jgi:hypothetical protein
MSIERVSRFRRLVLVEHPGAVWEPYCATHHSAEEELIDFENRHRGKISKRLIKYAGEIPSLIERLTGGVGIAKPHRTSSGCHRVIYRTDREFE